MKLILSGGGGIKKNPAAYQLFRDSVDPKKPVLILTQAVTTIRYTEVYESHRAALLSLGIEETERCDDLTSLPDDIGSLYGGVMVSGGNTYRLLGLLKESGAAEKLRRYFEEPDSVYIGSSAGAIIMGYDIEAIGYMDANVIALGDTHGFNYANGWSIIAHYGNGSCEQRNREDSIAVPAYSKKVGKILALPEEAALLVEQDRTTLVGTREALFYENGVKTGAIRPGETLNR